jgi:hypothetical protein
VAKKGKDKLRARKGSRSRSVDFQLREDAYKKKPKQSELASTRLILMVSESELEAIRQYQIQNQIRDRSEALRKIIHKHIPEVRERL